ncbi:MAG: hypothetical protein EP330_04990 [Deltaproteobacteria bacterium]|nr:MAG: hypothetical protein EP330_04990 [Deltaproteobacteria bacterium]
MLSLVWLLTASAVAAEPWDPSGTWVLEYRITTRADLPVVGFLKTNTTNVVLVQLQRDGDEWVQQHLLCSSTTSGGLVKSELPEPFLARIGPRHYPVRIDVSHELAVYEADTGAFTTGYDPTCGPLPDDIDDPCVTDWDRDGIAGATARVKPPLFPWGEVYVAQRNHIALHGSAIDPDRFEGSVQVLALKTRVLGASNPRYVKNPVIRVDEENSVFVMERARQAKSCEDVVKGLR